MITTPKDYFSLYHRIQSKNAPSLAVLLPTNEKIYSIDLNSRVIEAPEYLSVEKDHKAEVIYFKVNRFYDFFDLTQSVCVIQYINALKESRIFVVPFYDVQTLSETEEDTEEEIMLFPWVIDKEATKVGGEIEFNIRFYQLSGSGQKFLYNLNTLPAKSKVLFGIGLKEEPEAEEEYLALLKDDIYAQIKEVRESKDLYWEES